MTKTLEIMFNDLIPETQKKVLELYGLKTAEDGNFDVLPLTVLECEE